MNELPAHRCSGAGTPAIVVLNGAGVGMGYWKRVEPGLAELGATLLYDRRVPRAAGRSLPPLGRHHVEELRRLIAAVALPSPVIVVAHSMGGVYGQLFARLHPDEIAGLVLVDATHPEQDRRFAPAMTGLANAMRGAMAGWERWFGPGSLSEVVRLDAIAGEIAAAPDFPDIPLTIITAATAPPGWLLPPALWDIHLANQAELEHLSPQGRQVMVASDHNVPLRQPQAIVDAVRRMLEAMKKGPGAMPDPSTF